MRTRQDWTYLIEVRVGLGLAHPVEVVHVDQLEVKLETRVGHVILCGPVDVGQVAQLLVAPVVQGGDAGSNGEKDKQTTHTKSERDGERPVEPLDWAWQGDS